MSIHRYPSRSRPDESYEVVITDDLGIVCECRGYSRKVEIGYRTGVRQHYGALCRHAIQAADDHGLPYRQPRFHWVSLTTGEAFPATHRPRGSDEHMLAYYHQRRLEPLLAAHQDRFPRGLASPDRDYQGRCAAMLVLPTQHLVIAVTGDVPDQSWTRAQVKAAIRDAGATLQSRSPTARTSYLVAGANPARTKVARAHELLTPIVSYPFIINRLIGPGNAPQPAPAAAGVFPNQPPPAV